MRLIENAWRELHRLWSIRISLFFGVLTGVALGLSAFVDVFNPYLFMGISVVVNVALIPLARLMKQKEPDPVRLEAEV
jgi:ABC-type nitrate/sulfonate/bicarbonate transport system permease component